MAYPLSKERLMEIWKGTREEMIRSRNFLDELELFYAGFEMDLSEKDRKELEDIRQSLLVICEMIISNIKEASK